MNAKAKLLKMVANLSEESCQCVLLRLDAKIGLLTGTRTLLANEDENFVINKHEFVESEHPRDNIGRFAPGGSLRADMLKSEVKKWDETGHDSPENKKIKELKGKLSADKRCREYLKDGSAEAIATDSRIAALQREIAEKTREEKRMRRLWLESKATKRIMVKKAKEYRDIDDEIDYIEEKYADRDRLSPTHGEVVFPNTKSGQKARAKYEKLKTRLEELDDEIEWDKVEDELP